jgi:hypothetical protein
MEENGGAPAAEKRRRTVPWLTLRAEHDGAEEQIRDATKEDDKPDGEEGSFHELESETEVDDDDFLLAADRTVKEQFSTLKARAKPPGSSSQASPTSPARVDQSPSFELLILTRVADEAAAQRLLSAAARRKGLKVKGKLSKMQRLCGYGGEDRREEYELLRVSTVLSL